MNEHETNPQRPTANSGEEPPQTAELPRDAAQPPAGQSEPAAHDTGGQWSPASEATPGAGYPPQSAPPAYQPIGHQQPPIWQPADPQPATWPGNSGYGAPAPGGYGPAHAEAGGYPAAGHADPGPGGYGQPDAGYGATPQPDAGYGPGGLPYGQPYPDTTQQHALPPWAQPVGVRQPVRPTRVGKIIAGTAAALLLALGAGGVGAWAALTLDDDGDAVPASDNRPAVAAPVVDRSSLAQIAAKVEDSVVSIRTGNGEGSGVVLTADGYVLSNNHVVASAQGGTVDVIFANGKSADAKIVGTDPRTDLAVVKADGVSDLTPADFGDSSSMQVGDTVLALGSPLGLQGSVTAGIISAKDRTIRAGGQQDNPLAAPSGVTSMSGLLQTDAPINPGNSGGALVNTNGEVIGINTAIATNGQGNGNIGVGFAIPSNRAEQVANQLRNGEKVSHPALGVSVTAADGGGALVRSVVEGSAAAKAGLKPNDVITQLNDKPVNDSDDVVAIVQSGKVGDALKVTFNRGGAEQTVTATLAEAS